VWSRQHRKARTAKLLAFIATASATLLIGATQSEALQNCDPLSATARACGDRCVQESYRNPRTVDPYCVTKCWAQAGACLQARGAEAEAIAHRNQLNSPSATTPSATNGGGVRKELGRSKSTRSNPTLSAASPPSASSNSKPSPKQSKSSMQPASTDAVPEESYPQPPSGSSASAPIPPCPSKGPAMGPCSSSGYTAAASPSKAGSDTTSITARDAVFWSQMFLQNLQMPDNGPQLGPTNGSSGGQEINQTTQPIDLLASGGSIQDVLTPEQNKKLDDAIDHYVDNKIASYLREKPFEKLLEPSRKGFQALCGDAAAALATICFGPEAEPVGYSAGAFAGGIVFDQATGKIIEKATTIPSTDTQTPPQTPSQP
jgi:hypothetical protein